MQCNYQQKYRSDRVSISASIVKLDALFHLSKHFIPHVSNEWLGIEEENQVSASSYGVQTLARKMAAVLASLSTVGQRTHRNTSCESVAGPSMCIVSCGSCSLRVQQVEESVGSHQKRTQNDIDLMPGQMTSTGIFPSHEYNVSTLTSTFHPGLTVLHAFLVRKELLVFI